MNKEFDVISILNNEALLETYAGVVTAIVDGSLDDIINREQMLSDEQDLKNEILNHMNNAI